MRKILITLFLGFLSISGTCLGYAFRALVFDLPMAKADVQKLKENDERKDRKLDQIISDIGLIKGRLGIITHKKGSITPDEN